VSTEPPTYRAVCEPFAGWWAFHVPGTVVPSTAPRGTGRSAGSWRPCGGPTLTTPARPGRARRDRPAPSGRQQSSGLPRVARYRPGRGRPADRRGGRRPRGLPRPAGPACDWRPVRD